MANERSAKNANESNLTEENKEVSQNEEDNRMQSDKRCGDELLETCKEKQLLEVKIFF